MTTDVAGALSGAPRIGLEALGDAELQQRVDRKYVVPFERLGALADVLCNSHTLLAVDGLTAFSYRSAYLDTTDLTCYQAHRQDRRLRWKARTRLYRDSGRCRFEVKLKTGRGDTDKHALLLSEQEFGQFPEVGHRLLTQVLVERYRQRAPAVLLPSLTVDHLRSTMVAQDGASRLTLDSALAFRSPTGGCARLRDGLVLLETKSRDGHGTADRLLREAGVRPVSVSKYCAGIALTRTAQKDQPWRRLLQQHFTRDSQTAVAA